MEKNNLDKQIKKALENFQAPFQENHWELMEQQLNDSANGDLSERLDDHIIREKLTQFTPEANPQHWEVMAAKLAALTTDTLVEDAHIDGVAYENLSELNPPYEEAHWELMEKKIEAELNWRNKVVRYKLMELALAFLFLFTFVQYLPNAKEIIQRFPDKKNQPAKMDNKIDQDKINATSPPIARIENQTDTETQTGTVNIPESIGTSDQFLNLEIRTLNTATDPVVLAPRKENSTTKNSKPSIIRNPQLINQIEKVEQSLIAQSNLVEEEKIRTDNYRNAAFLMGSLDLLASVEESPLDQPEYALPDCVGCLKKKSKSYLRIGTKGIGTMDFYTQKGNEGATLNKQEDFEELTEVRNYEFGYGGGLSIGVRKDNWEFETGLTYSTKNTNPETIFLITDESLINGRSGTAWVGSTLDLLQIPINVRYDFFNKTKWKIYGQTGTTFNLALNVIDRYQDIVLKSPQNFRAPDGDIKGLTRSEVPAVTENGGLSQGGSLLQNTFLTIDVGLGVERQLNERYSAFLQSNFHQTLGSFGIRKSGLGIGTLGIQTGFKFSFVKRKPNLSARLNAHSHSQNIQTQ